MGCCPFTLPDLERLTLSSLQDISNVLGLKKNGSKSVLLEGIWGASSHGNLSSHRKRRLVTASPQYSRGTLFFSGPFPCIDVVDGASIQIGDRTWLVSCTKNSLQLMHFFSSNDRRIRRAQLLVDIYHELSRRRQDLLDLRAEQNLLLDQFEAVDTGVVESLSQQLLCITLARKTHKKRIEELEIILASGTAQTCVNWVETITNVSLPAGISATSNSILNVGRVLWIPGEDIGNEALFKESKIEKVVQETCSLVVGIGGRKQQWMVPGIRCTAVYADEVFVTCVGPISVRVFDLDGILLREWGTEGEGVGEFMSPTGIEVYDDEVYVCDLANHRVQVLGRDGTYHRQWGYEGAGQGEFICPWGITCTTGKAFVSDFGNHRVQVFTITGVFLQCWGEEGMDHGFFDNVFGLAYEENCEGGEVFVCDANNDRIQVFNEHGVFLREWGTSGREHGQFSCPVGVYVYNHEVFVCDSSNYRVQVFNANGQYLREIVLSNSNHDGVLADEPWGIGPIFVSAGEVFVCDRDSNLLHIF